MNSGGNVLGQGNRANLTIGRAVQLVVRNVGGGRPGEVDRATHGNPGKISFCFAEDEDGSPFTSLAVSRGFDADADTRDRVRRRGAALHRRPEVARDPESLANVVRRVPAHAAPPEAGARLRRRSSWSAPSTRGCFADAGWDRERVLAELHARLQIPGSELVRGAGGIAEGVPEHLARRDAAEVPARRDPARPRRRRRRAVLGDDRRLGERRRSGSTAGHPGRQRP